MEGNTWGNSTSFIGFLSIIPAVYLMVKFLNASQEIKTARLIIGLAAIIGLVFTFWSIITVKIRMRTEILNDGPVSFYPPDIGYQIFAVAVCCYIIYVFSKLMMSKG